MADIKVKPLCGRVLVKPLEKEEVTSSGLIIPDTAEKEKPQQGVIVALGTGKINEEGKKIDFSVKVGDTVLFKKYSPDEVTVDEIDYLVIEEDDILAVVK